MSSFNFQVRAPLTSTRISFSSKQLNSFYFSGRSEENLKNLPNPKISQLRIYSISGDVEITRTGLPKGLVPELLPKHVALTPDGHRRWAFSRGLPIESCYKYTREKVKMLVNLCDGLGIPVVNVFLISTDNWLRPKVDVDAAVTAIQKIIEMDYEEYARRGVKISSIGDKTALPFSMQRIVSLAEDATKNNKGLHLLLALNYGGRQDITTATKRIAAKVSEGRLSPDDIDEKLINEELETRCCSEHPYPDLIIRAGGEQRLSNTMLWQSAYTELYFAKKMFPDFEEEDFIEALIWYQGRTRRFGANGHV